MYLRVYVLNVVAIFLLCLMESNAQAAGFRFIEVPADSDNPALRGAIWYPCTALVGDVDLGSLIVPGTKDCPINGNNLPLIVISHGNLGAFFDHHDTAEMLADAGFVVAAISHRGDNVPNFADGADPSVMVARPGDITRLINYMTGASVASSHIDSKRIGFFGFSAGAYTGLVLIGARPDWAAVFCRLSSAPEVCARTLEKQFQAGAHAPELRVKAAVIADPPGMFFKADSFLSIRTPVQLWASENGGRGLPHINVMPEGVAAIDRNLLEKHEYHVVLNAGHFAFLLCGPSIKPVPEYCRDVGGFDRVAFHKQFNAEVLRFFRAQLGGQ